MALITRAGQYLKQPTGYRAFIPAPLPPNPAIQVDASTLSLLSTASGLAERLTQAGILEEITGGQRHRRYRYTQYLSLFTSRETAPAEQVPVQTTESDA